VALLPHLGLQHEPHGIEHDEIQRIAGTENRELADALLVHERAVVLHAQRRDDRRRTLPDVEHDPHAVFTEPNDARVHLGVAVPALPVEHLNAEHVPPELLPVEVFTIPERGGPADEAEGKPDQAAALALARGDGAREIRPAHTVNAVEIQVADLRRLTLVAALRG
jgi:hypothetical protein